jgi:hypothetical protein
MSDHCIKCGGLIMRPGVVYGYAGLVCYCPEPQRSQQNNYSQGGLSQGQNQMSSQYVYDVVNKILAALLRIEEKLK